MARTISVSYLTVFFYGLFIFVSTLLVGILPPLVNLPICDPNDASQNSSIAQKKLDICPELIDEDVGIILPWDSPRLPQNVVPTNYEILLIFPSLKTNMYKGRSEITVTLTDVSDTFVIHKKFINVNVTDFKDSDDKSIEIGCAGDFPKRDLFVFKTRDYLQPGTYRITYVFEAFLDKYESGLFSFNFKDDKTMIISKFEPIDARKAFPCFDEPNFKTTYSLTIHHPNDTIALSNGKESSEPGENGMTKTTFEQTPKISSHLIAIGIFNENEIVPRYYRTSSGREVRLWGRKELFDAGYADDSLLMIVSILNKLEEVFIDVIDALPRKLDIIASPLYPIDASSSYGIPVFKENKILFKLNSISESDRQNIALLISKQLSEIWFGGYVTFDWWSELWKQEALGDYFKYYIVNQVYPHWEIYNQFVTEELISVLVDDAYPSSHPVIKDIDSPYQIEEYFDSVERSKATAIFRMIEEEISREKFLTAIITYLEANSWGTGSSQLFFSQLGKIGPWQATDFADRWFKQPNYPVLDISILNSSNQNFYLNVQQSRFINTNDSVFGSESIYPSPYNWTWYIPLNCIFFVNGSSIHEQKFYIETQKYSELIDDGKTEYDFFHCDINFSGYFSLNYPHENWIAISAALNDQESVFTPVDRSNIIHNLFMNAFTSRLPYKELTQTLVYLIAEREYLPWKTVNFHLSEMVSILEYKEPFFEVASYFDYFLRTIENEVDLWNPSGNHVEELYKETILKTACLLQDSFCLKNASFLWEKYRPYLTDPMANNILPSYVKKIVFNYHLQNTYFAEDWELVYSEFNKIDDLSEREKLLEALTFTRLPWFLEIYLQRLEDDLINFFDKIKFLSKNCLGREFAWNYIRANFDNLLEEFGLDDPRLGQMVIDVSSTFETESLNYELLNFITSTPNGASLNARYRALEKVSINLLWLRKKSKEIIEAFGSPRKNIFI